MRTRQHLACPEPSPGSASTGWWNECLIVVSAAVTGARHHAGIMHRAKTPGKTSIGLRSGRVGTTVQMGRSRARSTRIGKTHLLPRPSQRRYRRQARE